MRRFFVTAAQLAGAATFNGPAMDLNDPQISGPGDNNRFGANVNSDVAGTMFIDGSFDGTTWRQQGSVAVTGGTPADLSLPIRFRYMRVRYTNGATQTGVGAFAIHASLTEL